MSRSKHRVEPANSKTAELMREQEHKKKQIEQQRLERVERTNSQNSPGLAEMNAALDKAEDTLREMAQDARLEALESYVRELLDSEPDKAEQMFMSALEIVGKLIFANVIAK